jgi:hypothetical protein
VVKKLALLVDEAFTTKAQNINSDNPAWQGWVFELDLIRKLRQSVRVKTCISLKDENNADLEIKICAVIEFTGKDRFEPTSNTLYLPTKWNQGCFDAVYYFVDQLGIHQFYFLGATIGESHDYNFKFIGSFLELCLEPPKRGNSRTDIKVTMAAVTSEANFDRHKVNVGRRENAKDVEFYDRTFKGEVQKFKLTELQIF